MTNGKNNANDRESRAEDGTGIDLERSFRMSVRDPDGGMDKCAVSVSLKSGKDGRPLLITRLAEMPRDAIANEAAIASIFGKTPRTIRRWIERGELPEPFCMGGERMWFAGAIIDWLMAKSDANRKEAEQKRDRHRRIMRKLGI